MEINKKVIDLSMDDILPNRFQPRIKFNEEAINELSESIKEHGVIQPIVVRPVGDKYEIIAGERRYKASTLAGKTSIPALVTDLNDKDSAEVALIENVQRQNLTPIEEAISYKKILDMGYLNQTSLADKLGKNQSTVANKLRLLDLTDEVQEALLDSKISERHARSLLRISNKSDQISMLNRIINERMTVRKTDEEIDKVLNNNEQNTSITNLQQSSLVEPENNENINTSESTLTFSNLFSDNPVNKIEETTVNPFVSTANETIEQIDFEQPEQSEQPVNPGFIDVDKIMSEAQPLENFQQVQKPVDELIPNIPTPSTIQPVSSEPVQEFSSPKFFNILGQSNEQKEEAQPIVESEPFQFDTLFSNNNLQPQENSIEQDVSQVQEFTNPQESVETSQFNSFGPSTPIKENEPPIFEVPFIETRSNEEQNQSQILQPEIIQNESIATPIAQVNFDAVKEVVQTFITKLDSLGFKSEADQFDLEDMYQVIFRIEKK